MFDITFDTANTESGYLDLVLLSILHQSNILFPVPVPVLVPIFVPVPVPVPTPTPPLDTPDYNDLSLAFPSTHNPTVDSNVPIPIYDIRVSLRQSSSYYPRSIFEEMHQYPATNSSRHIITDITDPEALKMLNIGDSEISENNEIITHERVRTFWKHDEDIHIQYRAAGDPETCRRELIEGIIYGAIDGLTDLEIATAVGITTDTKTFGIAPIQLLYRRNDPALALTIEIRLMLNEILENYYRSEEINFPTLQAEAIGAAISKNITTLLRIITQLRMFLSELNEPADTPTIEDISTAIRNGNFEEVYNMVVLIDNSETINEALRIAFRTLQGQRSTFTPLACQLDDIIKFFLTRGAESNLKMVCRLIIGGSRNVASYLNIVFQHYPEFTIDADIPGSALTLLIMAIIDRNIAAVEILISEGANINQPGADSLTPLMHAVSTGQYNIVSRLLRERAVAVNHPSINNETALTIAAIYGHTEIGDLLIRSSAEVNHVDNVEYTPLMRAALNGHPEFVDRLLQENGINIEQASANMGYTALTLAINNGYTEIASRLIEAGANVNHIDSRGYTVLMDAVRNRDIDSVITLLQTERIGIDQELEANGYTALTIAAIAGNAEIVQLLIQNGADAHHSDSNGYTPLAHAVINNRLDTVRTITETTKFTTEELEKIKEIATKRKYTSIVQILNNKILEVEMGSISWPKALTLGLWGGRDNDGPNK